jgi:aminobenzoyl-glutamate transport protein
MGRNPLAGLMCAYASVTGAFACNVIVTSMDVITVSFTEAAAKMVIPDISLSPAIGYYYSLATVVPVTIAAVLITTHIVEPRLGKYTGKGIEGGTDKTIAEHDYTALKYALWSMAAFIAIICIGVIPEHGILKDPATGSALSGKSPLMQSLAFIIALMFFIPGVVFGKVSGKFNNCRDVAKAMGKAMSDMGTYIAIIFVIAQFLKYFDWSNLGIIIAIKGAEILQSSGFPISIVVVLFILMCSVLNLFIGSASTKWAILSAVFVPMFMFLGYHPALPQMAYLIGDAVTNPICPTDAYFSMLLVLAQKYDPEAGIGTLLANMTPYAITYLIIMTGILMIWFFGGLPLGPGAPLRL